MDIIFGIIFLLATILMGLISNEQIKLNKLWIVVIFLVQIASWMSYIYLLDIEKHYKIGLSVLSMCALCIIGFFYIVK